VSGDAPETCPTACVDYNHPGREHDEWVGSIRVLGALAGYKAAEEDASIERADLTARLARVEALPDKWRTEKNATSWPDPMDWLDDLVAALAAPTPTEDQQ
jgi:hypothetical protein